MDSRMIEFFFELCRVGNISTASQTLLISRQTISQELKELEHELGATLFTRKKSGVELTPAGRVFRDGMLRIQADFERLGNETRNADKGIEEVIRFGCNFAHLDTLTSQILADYQHENPQVKVYVSHIPEAQNCWRQLQAGDLELVLTANLARNVTLPFYSSGIEDGYLAVSSQSTLAAKRKIRLPDDAAGLTVGIAAERERAVVERITGGLANILFNPTMSIARSRIEEGTCAAVLAKRQADDYASDRCILIPIEDMSISTLFVMSNHPSAHVKALAQRLSGSTVLRDHLHDPLPYQDDPGWPLIRQGKA